jgi:cob(I)alamin adenosyltransferase
MSFKIYTRTGDDGTTGLFGGQRVSKAALRVHAYGTVDELNSVLGLAAATSPDPALGAILADLQAELFVLGSDLATPLTDQPDKPYVMRLPAAADQRLEGLIDACDQRLPPLKNFILPGGHPCAAYLHLARTVCRRAERLAVELAEVEPLSEGVITYLNRLSDLLFTLARWTNALAGLPDVEWRPRG